MSTETRKKQQDPPFPLRMPIQLRDQVEQAAADNNRSVNGELVHRLQGSFGASRSRGRKPIASQGAAQ